MIDKTIASALVERYVKYAYSFSSDGVLLSAMKKLKFDHSMRVASVAKKIATLEGWTEREILLAEMCGIFHDIGRYRQYREYKTFQDYKSVNHAELGCRVMQETNCLDLLEEREREIVLEATRYHNVKKIPDGLTPEIDRYARLVRDSDKLDIYFVIYDAISNDKLEDYPEITHDVDLKGGPSEEILRQVRAHEQISYTDMRSLVDFELILMQWAYEMNFRATYRIMLEREIIEKMRSIVPEHADITEVIDDAANHVRQMAG